MPLLSSTRSTQPSKVHHTEYIRTKNNPDELATTAPTKHEIKAYGGMYRPRRLINALVRELYV